MIEHEIGEKEVDVQMMAFLPNVDKPGWWWVQHTCNEAYKLEPEVTEEVAREAMKEASFGYIGGPAVAAHMDNPVTSYSGDWKMRMQLTAAKLLNADVLMLDGPTGHSDMNDMSGLRTGWRPSLAASSVPHTSTPFLDKMCTHSVDFQDRKLKTFKGTKGSCLTQLVEKHPERHISKSASPWRSLSQSQGHLKA